MRILHVIHGYPPRYNAGSEVYTQMLAGALAARHDVHVFTRQEDPFAPDYELRRETDPLNPRVQLWVVNVARSRDRYRHEGVDHRFGEVLDEVGPDIVHVGHLNHLSTSLLQETTNRRLPVVFTLHDYWLMCPRGQFIQMHPEDSQDPWAVCPRQEDQVCAERCYARYFSGDPAERHEDVAYWAGWVGRRTRHVREMAGAVDLFLAPSRYLEKRFLDGFGVARERLRYLDYGFDHARLAGRRRTAGEPFTFGYIGTHQPAKGVHLLIEAFARVTGDVRLRIWGRPRGEDTAALHAQAARLPREAAARIEWLPEYLNEEIVPRVFDRVDAVVVPSIWVENSPLVLHEAQQARVPVITADVGGMAEYVRDGENGLLFRHRDAASLAEAMQRFACDPESARRLGARGYLHAGSGDVPEIGAHARDVEELYREVLDRRRPRPPTPEHEQSEGPWRITLDTNPDTCNLRCIMCEEHSPHSNRQAERRAAGRPRRIMPLELLERVIREAAAHGLREVIPSTMGEPLLYEHFDAILGLCRAHGVKLNLTTNGTFPGRGAVAWAEALVPLTSDVKISWNGATPATHEAVMLGTRWEKVLANVRSFVTVRDRHAAQGGNRCRVTFQLTFLETNVHELAGVVRLAAGLGVDRVKGHHLWAHFDAIRPLSMRRDAGAIRRWNDAVVEAVAAAEAYRRHDGTRVQLENIFPLDPAAPEDLVPGGVCPFLGREAWVSAEGRFDPCCAPDALRRGLGDFGSLHERGLMEIWEGAEYRDLTATYQERPLCRGCNMRRPVESTR